MKNDIELSLAAGFNEPVCIRKLLKNAFIIGLINWDILPGRGTELWHGCNSVEVARNFLQEWSELVLRDRNHPSLLIWTPMNEEWWPDHIQYPRFTTDLYDLTKALDLPSGE